MLDPRTVQPVASRYTDYATRPTHYTWVYVNVMYHIFHVNKHELCVHVLTNLYRYCAMYYSVSAGFT